jgi:manganese oxidase
VLGRAPPAAGPAEPLVLHVTVGDCIDLTLANRTAEDASLHVHGLAYDPHTTGLRTGRNGGRVVAPGASGRHRFYADPDIGPTVALLHDGADVLTGPGLGLYGAVVVSDPGSRPLDPSTGEAVTARSGWNFVIDGPDGRYRDFTLFMQDQDAALGSHRMPYSCCVDGPVGINYQTATRPIGPSADHEQDPPTPRLEAFAGDPVRIHLLLPWSEQFQVFSVEGHRWSREPGLEGTDLLDSRTVGGLTVVTLHIEAAGGIEHLPGDYLYGDHRGPYLEAGLWGILRVHEPGRPDVGLLPLDPAAGAAPPSPARLAALLLAGGLLLVAVLLAARR